LPNSVIERNWEFRFWSYGISAGPVLVVYQVFLGEQVSDISLDF